MSSLYIDLARGIEKFLSKTNHTEDPLMSIMARQRVGTHSTGEVQKAMLAELTEKLQGYKGLVIVDEPEKGLDPWQQREMQDKIRNIAPEATILVITHNPFLVFSADVPRIDLRFPQKGVHINTEESI